jgi:SAM-dependent methyltransferase
VSDWDIKEYEKSMSDIEILAAPLLAMLNEGPIGRVLDIGCGDGRLSLILKRHASSLVAIDSSPAMVEASRNKGIDAFLMDASKIDFEEQFDTIVSHAVLHWIREAEETVKRIARALRPNGRFIAMFGGHGDCRIIRSSLIEAAGQKGFDVRPLDPWFNPTVEQYSKFLANADLQQIIPVQLIPWEFPLPQGMATYVRTFFSNSLLSPIPEHMRESVIHEAVEMMRHELCDEKGNWHADFVRMKVQAKKASKSEI